MISFAPLSEQHDTSSFRSGAAFLDHYLQNEAGTEQARYLARTFVAVDTETDLLKPIGYFTLKMSPQYVPEVSEDWLALAELAYLARHVSWRGKGLGPLLLLESLQYVKEASLRLGIPGVLLYATEEGARLYEAYRFRKVFPDRRVYYLSMPLLHNVLSQATDE